MDKKQKLREEARTQKVAMNRFCEQSLEKWSRIKELREGSEDAIDLTKLALTNPKKAMRVAHALQMQEKALTKINETTMSTAYGMDMRPINVIRVVYRGVANSKRGDIFNEIPLATTNDRLIFVDARFSDTLRDGTADAKIYKSDAKYYAGETYEAVLGTGNGSNVTFSATVTPNPIIPYHTRILVGGAQAGVDSGTGTLVGEGIASGTVTYSSGLISAVLNSAPASGVVVKAIFNWNSESSANYTSYGKITLNLEDTKWNARPMPLGYNFTDMTQLVWESTGLGSFMTQVEKAVGDAHARMTDFRAIARAKEVALMNEPEYFNTDHASEGWVDGKAYAQFLNKKISEVNAKVFNAEQRGIFNKIIVGRKALAYFELLDNYQAVTGDFYAGVYQAGKLSGNIDVFTCPANDATVADNEALLIYTNPDADSDFSLLYGVMTELSASLRYPQMYQEGYIAKVEDCKLVNSAFIRRLVLQNL